MDLTTILAAVAAVLVPTFMYLHYQYRYSHWKKRGVPHPKPLPLVGNFAFMITRSKSFSTAFMDFATPYKENGYCGVYQFGQPLLLVWDPEMVKQVVTKDFSSFHDRGLPSHEHDPLSQHLFNLSGTKWRNLRNRLSPSFTSGKLKLMFPLMRDIGDELNRQVTLDAKKTDSHEVEISALLSRYATDVIGSVAFGIQCNCLRDQQNEFLEMSKKLFRQSPAQLARLLLELIHPKLGGLLPIKWVFSRVHHFFVNLIKDTVEYREKNNVERNDFVQLMMQLRTEDLAHVDPENHIELTYGVMAAQGFVFFIAGLDNVANTISFALNKLSVDPELQQKLADEVRGVLRQHDGELTYAALKQMDLLNRVLLEAMRLWSPVGMLIRKCNATTKVGDVVVDKGQMVFVLTQVAAMDENQFPEPQRFDPDRHTREAKDARHPYAFSPFGEGPRNCIAERFALLEMRLALALLIRDFVFTPGPRYEPEVELDQKSFFPRPKNGFHLQVAARV
ncbi:Cytochrome P450 CYP6 [Frankliniella occidentalis]|uniref:Probable cytochrome P450 6a14 n=1 Tax=Frankliniella occidentalis TaxID=133901 RepID=A0A6J1S4P1_FRAOC|nr:probable cytochrome P450 6a14 [Frankliniella occidentalis]KAE8737515.1 Cytochrome P450 CYP6 [Frankliniella occidentalis]WBV79780.1 cytochrome P450 6EC1 [Thrips tabaci]